MENVMCGIHLFFLHISVRKFRDEEKRCIKFEFILDFIFFFHFFTFLIIHGEVFLPAHNFPIKYVKKFHWVISSACLYNLYF